MSATRIRDMSLNSNLSGLGKDLPRTFFAQRHILPYCLSLALCLLIAGCSSTPRQGPMSNKAVPDRQKNGVSTSPQSQRPGVHIVRRGDTLYSIATSNNINPRELAAWNNLPDPGAIRIGQEIFLSRPEGPVAAQPTLFAIQESAPSSSVVAPASPAQPRQDSMPMPEARQPVPVGKVKTEPKAFKLPYSEQALAQVKSRADAALPVTVVKVAPAVEKTTPAEISTISIPPSEAIRNNAQGEWVWPAKGRVADLFSESTKGIDIVGMRGQTVAASAGGKVVYSGEGLRGYGKLIIIKHSDTYLSAYAHNSKLLVKEGETVIKGQKIAEMGSTDAGLVKLHFEIRKNGKPVDPLKYLPGISG
ncbi:peptidoglycan DD-metalloendopeptidase family protein [Nitrosospira multiformis]|uniref:Lipoprotein NlpD n=1 Tax=Nitrosospira multiformis (strain ATCC 25196 / NCIMB 11849 / C 71) TaxID=323848 RepID=Q2YBR6_NITMU|nr:peptidoglycan DD-metalloendopeptidase family protein [Nitrosospira multiformis]ABB73805.1 peptidase M23B [Nitrosospira multiformis ATCC 25196]SDZ73557.1 lipoprotein NlpD [Nitrosospira multiformis]SEF42269.1 lipoprotein NlpD [Nitrosospira multiformis ATCC 25196]